MRVHSLDLLLTDTSLRYVIEGFRGSLELEIAEGYLEGIACSLDSDGHAALVAATQQVALHISRMQRTQEFALVAWASTAA